MRKKKKNTEIYGVVGLGRFGFNLAKNLAESGKEVICIDNDPKKIGTMIIGKEVFSFSRVKDLTVRLGVVIARLTVPKECAQSAAIYLAGSGIKYIWNFTPCILDVPKGVKVWNENLIGSFLQFTNSD